MVVVNVHRGVVICVIWVDAASLVASHLAVLDDDLLNGHSLPQQLERAHASHFWARQGVYKMTRVYLR
jgi:hypothetical protein